MNYKHHFNMLGGNIEYSIGIVLQYQLKLQDPFFNLMTYALFLTHNAFILNWTPFMRPRRMCSWIKWEDFNGFFRSHLINNIKVLLK